VLRQRVRRLLSWRHFIEPDAILMTAPTAAASVPAPGAVEAVLRGSGLNPVAVQVATLQPAHVAMAEAVAEALNVLCVLDHPNIVRVLGVCVTDDSALWLVTAACGGGSLRTADALLRADRIDVRMRPLAQAATALQHVHAAGLHHGSITPDAILFTDSSRRRACLAGTALADATRAPLPSDAEIFRAPDTIFPSVAADVYALGVVTLWLLLGSAAAAVAAATPGGLVAAVERVSELGSSGRRVLAACLSHEPSARPAAQALAEALTI
jgi:serine/threonine protein kinase